MKPGQQNLHRSKRLLRPQIIELLNDALIDDLNIYHQAYLSLDGPLMECSVQHQITKYEYPIIFNLSGDLSGNIICLLDSYKKVIKDEENSLFQSLYIESMNILLGQYLTKVEDVSNLSLLLSPPVTLTENMLKKVINENDEKKLRLGMGYQFIYNMQEFNCRILFDIKHTKFSEV